MTALAFDTHALIKKLIAAGVPESQAEAQVEVLTTALATNLDELVTKRDLQDAVKDLRQEIAAVDNGLRQMRMDNRFEKELAPIKSDLYLLKWMMGIVISGILALVLKAFF